MKFLKGLLVSFLSLILFFSLSLFGLAFMLNQTLLKADFVNKELDKLNIAQLAKELLPQMMPQGFQLPGLPISVDQATVTDAITRAITKVEPELKQQAKLAVSNGYNYLLGKSGKLSIIFSLESIKNNLKENLRQTFLEALQKSPPQINGVPPEMAQQYINQYFDQFYQQYAVQIPDTYTVSDTTIPPNAASQLKQVKMYIGYYQTGFYVLIGVIALLVLGIILIEWNLKSSFRSLGINLLLYGAIGFVIGYVSEKYLPGMAPIPADFSPYLVSWLTGVINDIMAPLTTFSIVVAAIGAVLLVISFFLKSPEAVTEAKI